MITIFQNAFFNWRVSRVVSRLRQQTGIKTSDTHRVVVSDLDPACILNVKRCWTKQTHIYPVCQIRARKW